MPTTAENIRAWNKTYAWKDEAEEWSSSYPGGSRTIWFGILVPRIQYFLPTQTILEIAPGMGRWTQYLKGFCHQLTAVDISEKCIKLCQDKFAQDSHASFYMNDGKSLAMVPDNSIDFVFSFDSLVHVEKDVIESYLEQLARKLKPNGAGFIHHSNLGAYWPYLKNIPGRIREPLGYGNIGWRGSSVSAELFAETCRKVGFECISQELVNWDTHRYFLLDAFSTFRKAKSGHARVFKNRDFMKQCYELIENARAVIAT